MMELIQKIFESPAGSFSFVLALMFLSGWLIYYVTKAVTKITVEHGQFSKRMDKTESEIEQIKTDIAKIKGLLVVRYESPLSKKKSPETLTDEGKKLVSDHNLDVFVNNNWSKITSFLKMMDLTNPYDIPEFCRTSSFLDTSNQTNTKFYSKEDVDKLKTIAFQTGYPLVLVTHVMGILIRDRYFEENGIKSE
ncbi:MAG: hypothetical protein FWH18_01490 [Marinilabiliaceae bacterium]|nr:hypothetical protein [Marinilabiliaceae bacterium]